jgi:hypothetical protein
MWKTKRVVLLEPLFLLFAVAVTMVRESILFSEHFLVSHKYDRTGA